MRSVRDGVIVALVYGTVLTPKGSVTAQKQPVPLFEGEVVNVRGDAARAGVSLRIVTPLRCRL